MDDVAVVFAAERHPLPRQTLPRPAASGKVRNDDDQQPTKTRRSASITTTIVTMVITKILRGRRECSNGSSFEVVDAVPSIALCLPYHNASVSRSLTTKTRPIVPQHHIFVINLVTSFTLSFSLSFSLSLPMSLAPFSSLLVGPVLPFLSQSSHTLLTLKPSRGFDEWTRMESSSADS